MERDQEREREREKEKGKGKEGSRELERERKKTREKETGKGELRLVRAVPMASCSAIRFPGGRCRHVLKPERAQCVSWPLATRMHPHISFTHIVRKMRLQC